MRKYVLAAGLLATTTLSIAQSNVPGTIHVGAGFSVLLGGAKVNTNLPYIIDDGTSIGARFNPGVRAQFGIAKAFSAGLYLRSESAAYISTLEDQYSGETYDRTFSARGFGVGAEAKFYMLNKDKFLMYVAPSIGFAASKDEDKLEDDFNNYNDYEIDGKSSGVEYGITFGFNWYWTKYIGMSLDLGFNRVSLKGEFDITSQYSSYDVKGLGFVFGVGLVSKFGGN